MRYKGSIDSVAINRQQEEALKELSSVSKKVNESINEMNRFKKVTDINAKATNNFLENVLADLNTDKILAKDMILNKAIYDSANSCIVKEPLDKKNKLRSSSIAPDDLFVELFEENWYTSVSDSGLNEFLSKGGTWCREIEATDRSVHTTIVISVPNSINPDTLINYIEFDVFPYYTATIENIEYSPYYDNNYLTPIDTIVNHKGHVFNPYGIEGYPLNGKAVLSFKDLDIKKIAITLKQDIKTDGNIFHLGLKDLKLERRIYNSDKATIDIPYKGTIGDSVTSFRIDGSPGDYVLEVYEKNGEDLIFIQQGTDRLTIKNENMVFRLTMLDNYFFIRSVKIHTS